ncbi:MAG: hypothetical protein KME45_18945 [Stenomitos rutilans HA7619-LM2]|jgi:hypothetical protein|nr:hypothetical protein [Stenomitos rutilans HA7619-LM2]
MDLPTLLIVASQLITRVIASEAVKKVIEGSLTKIGELPVELGIDKLRQVLRKKSPNTATAIEEVEKKASVATKEENLKAAAAQLAKAAQADPEIAAEVQKTAQAIVHQVMLTNVDVKGNAEVGNLSQSAELRSIQQLATRLQVEGNLKFGHLSQQAKSSANQEMASDLKVGGDLVIDELTQTQEGS